MLFKSLRGALIIIPESSPSLEGQKSRNIGKSQGNPEQKVSLLGSWYVTQEVVRLVQKSYIQQSLKWQNISV